MKKTTSLLLAVTLLLLLIAGCKSRESKNQPDENTLTSSEQIEHNKALESSQINLVQLNLPKAGDTLFEIDTTNGTLYGVLYPEKAPLAVENFTTLAQEGFYNGSTFNSVVENFYVQSGAPSGKEDKSIFTDKKDNPIPFENEIDIDLWHFRGALAMMNEGISSPDSNTSKFFIVQAKTIANEWFEKMENIGFPTKVIDAYKENGGIPGYDTHYTVFGQVYSGLDVLDSIGETEVDDSYKPVEDIYINSIKISTYEEGQNLPMDITENQDLNSETAPEEELDGNIN